MAHFPKTRLRRRAGVALLSAFAVGSLVAAPTLAATAATGAGPAHATSSYGAMGDPFAASQYLAAERAGYGSPKQATIKYERAEAAASRIAAQTDARMSGMGDLASSPWTALGPTSMIGGYGTNNNSGFYAGPNSGRVDSLAVSTSGEIFAGTAGGGVWASTTDGDLWTPMTDHVPTGLAIGALATDPENSKIVYAATGEDNECGDCFYGAGILKSTDNGKKWAVENPDGIFTGVDFDSLVVDPGNDRDLYAGTSAGFFESTDGGAQWAAPTGTYVNRATWGVVVDPSTTPATIYTASTDVGIQKSTDGGVNFTVVGKGLPPATEFGFTALGIGTATAAHPTADEDLYAAVQLQGTALNANGGDLSLYASKDGGANWSLLTTPAYTNQAYAYGSGTADQAFYDNTLAVDPTNPEHVLAGGIALVATSDGGKTWTNVDDGHSFFASNSNVIHPDQHALAFDGSSVLIGNDGGVYDYSAPLVLNLNSTLETGQFYQDLGVYDDGAEILGGLQDNGTAFYDGQSQWSEVIAGDGGYNAINPLDPSQQFGEADEGLYTTTDSWQSSPRYITPKALHTGPLPKEPGGPDPVLAANFVPAMTIVPNHSVVDAPTVYYGGSNLYVTTDPASAPPTWTRITNHTGSFVASIAVAPSKPSVLYVGFDDGTVLVSTDATSAHPTFTDISPGIPLWITHIAVSPSNPGRIALSFSDNNTQFQAVPPMVETASVTLTGTPAATYSNVTGNLPNGISSNSVLFDHGSLVVATDVGTFFTTKTHAGATVWSTAGLGLPDVEVIGLTEDAQGNLYAATHGRGVWKLTLHPAT
jgi:hypothetical protein